MIHKANFSNDKMTLLLASCCVAAGTRISRPDPSISLSPRPCASPTSHSLVLLVGDIQGFTFYLLRLFFLSIIT